MKIFIAGASGAIGRPLVAELVRGGHTVLGMSRSEAGKRNLMDMGASAEIIDALDEAAVTQALARFQPEIVIDELTALPQDPWDYPAAFAGDRKLRLEGGGNLHRAAQGLGVRRYIQQASGFFLKATDGLADESAPLATDASPGVAASARTYAELEARLANSGKMEAVVLRYGFFYGPKTWYSPDGASAGHIRRRETPVIGRGEAVWSWIHIDDAALATAVAISVPPGKYNIVDDDPSPASIWLPAFAGFIGAPPAPQITEQEALGTVGPEAVYYGTKLIGASNAKAKRTFNFTPRTLEWLH